MSHINDLYAKVYRLGCDGCPQKDRKIEKIQQRLEHSLYTNRVLLLECKRLRNALQDARWEAEARVRTLQPLPNEIWHKIFALAARFEGVASNHIHACAHGSTWRESLRTRRSIPLVCRQWHIVGSEFLYNRLVFYRTSQIQRVKETLRLHPEYKVRCRSIELAQIQPRADLWNEATFYESAKSLIRTLPQIHTLVIDPLQPLANFTGIGEVLDFVRPKLQNLRIPACLDAFWSSLTSSTEAKERKPPNFQWESLQTLSLIPVEVHLERSIDNGIVGMISDGVIPNLKTLCFDYLLDESSNLLHLVKAHSSLTKIHLGVRGSFFIMRHLEEFLDLAPNLEVLVLELSPQVEPAIDEGRDRARTHCLLHKIVIQTRYSHYETFIPCIKPILQKIDGEELPNCKVIEVWNGSVDGCLDPDFAPIDGVVQDCKEAIHICNANGVAFIDEEGQKLYVWADRNGIKFTDEGMIQYTSSDESDGDSESSNEMSEEGWTEDDGERSATPEWQTSGEEELDDSDDSPYIYRSQPDIRPIEEDSGTDE